MPRDSNDSLSGTVALQSWPRELRLIAACIRQSILPRPDACLHVLAEGAPDWILFLTLALEHNVAGLVAAGLTCLPEGCVPPVVQAALAEHQRHCMDANRAALHELGRLVSAMDAEGIASAPLKGPWLSLRAYGHLWARPSRDLDLFIQPQSVTAALRVLDGCGYDTDARFPPRYMQAVIADDCELLCVARDGGFLVEPHWAYVPRNLALRLDLRGVWRRMQRQAADGNAFLTFCVEDELIMLCVHGGKEEWARLKWLADLGALIQATPSVDWQVLAERAGREGVGRLVNVGVLVLHRVLEIEVPLLGVARRDPAAVRITRDVLCGIQIAAARRGVRQPVPVHAFSSMRARLLERRVDRLRYWVRTTITPRQTHYYLVPLPVSLHSLYVVVKPCLDYALLPLWLVGRRLLVRRPRAAARARSRGARSP
jgi:hypothetical protein